MKIIFNLLDCGLNNNGGSDTIVRSANTLIGLGHEVYFVDNINGHYDWQPVKAEIINPRFAGNIPDADAVIHTGFKSVLHSSFFLCRCRKQFHWIRGWETWTYPEDYIVSNILTNSAVKIVNGIQLQSKLFFYNINSTLVRPGNDTTVYGPLYCRDKTETVVIGGIFNQGEKRQKKRTHMIFKAYELLSKKHNIKLWMYGNEGFPERENVKYFVSPNEKQKNYIYNKVDIWLAPTSLEGLHRPPMEAMLTECPVVGTDAEMSGMDDYLVDGKTGIVSKNNLDDFVCNIERLIKSKSDRKRMGVAARQKILELGSREDNMKKLVEVLQSC